ncbi:MAG: Glycosyl hydrolase family 57 [Candidatus Ozemobacter sibiricus]|uniref:Glycosyl hydrolase family 57 n=1 Tax=Candidatus Ozemobacter sibiricus TaxID=2268124 RepID=A0A367ZSU3_9BACT|nr:MAG: Glycosyl hydrolase family 57 [Candidatus Ozemobacter sibiricus]
MSRPLHFAFVLHAHQPVANPDAVVRQVILTAYRPVLTELAARPALRFTLHLSGSLLDRLERLDPELVELIGTMVERGQVELLGGAYHEALLPLIPAVDRHGQLTALRTRLHKAFGVSPRGAWLAERFWEPALAHDLAEAGYQYTLLDEHGFLQVGFSEDRLDRPWLTEDQGSPLGIFPISKGLRYLLPYAEPEQALQILHNRAVTHPGSVWVFADDLEKFGAWPGTWPRVHEQGWLRGFLDQASEAATGPLPWVTLAEAWEAVSPGGLAYLPTTSYPEIMRWSLPPALRRDQTRAGFPRHFLVRYPEVNLIHKRMLAASQAVHDLPHPPPDLLHQLWISQTACPYWYGWFGGAYLPGLRLHAKAAATRAETLALKKARRPLRSITHTDFDLDGQEEVVVSTLTQWVLARPVGATLSAWEDRQTGFDPLAIMNPWPEEGAPGDAPAETVLPFEDLILAPGATLDHLLHRQMPVLATLRHRRFATETFEDPHALGVRFALRAPLPLPDGDRHLELTKTFRLDDQQCRLTLDLELVNPEPRPLELSYGLRLPLASLASPNGHPFALTVPEVGLTDLDGLSVGEVCGISTLRWGPRPGGPPPERGALALAGTRLTIDRPVTVWYSPLLTEIMLEGKATPIFQALVLVFLVQLRIDREGRAGLRFTFTLGEDPDHG